MADVPTGGTSASPSREMAGVMGRAAGGVAAEGMSWATAKRSGRRAVPISGIDFGASPAGAALVFGNERRGKW